jgi:hypothetical protein
VVRGVPRWLCFDACPTYACLPFVAARAKAMTPHAKLVVMVSARVAGMHDHQCARWQSGIRSVRLGP